MNLSNFKEAQDALWYMEGHASAYWQRMWEPLQDRPWGSTPRAGRAEAGVAEPVRRNLADVKAPLLGSVMGEKING
jgi:hypothetical protein